MSCRITSAWSRRLENRTLRWLVQCCAAYAGRYVKILMIFSFIIFPIFLSLGFLLFLVHGVYVHKLGTYLERNHPSTWEDFEPKTFMGFSQEYLKSRNYFKEIKFYLKDDTLSDEYVTSTKKKIRIFLMLAVAFELLAILVFIVG